MAPELFFQKISVYEVVNSVDQVLLMNKVYTAPLKGVTSYR